MTTPSEKRLKLNEYKRKWYADLPEERKMEIRQRRREAYHNKKYLKKQITINDVNINDAQIIGVKRSVCNIGQSKTLKREEIVDIEKTKGKTQVTCFSIFETG